MTSKTLPPDSDADSALTDSVLFESTDSVCPCTSKRPKQRKQTIKETQTLSLLPISVSIRNLPENYAQRPLARTTPKGHCE